MLNNEATSQAFAGANFVAFESHRHVDRAGTPLAKRMREELVLSEKATSLTSASAPVSGKVEATLRLSSTSGHRSARRFGTGEHPFRSPFALDRASHGSRS